MLIPVINEKTNEEFTVIETEGDTRTLSEDQQTEALEAAGVTSDTHQVDIQGRRDEVVAVILPLQ